MVVLCRLKEEVFDEGYGAYTHRETPSSHADAASPVCTVGHLFLANVCGYQIWARLWRRLQANDL